MQCVHCDTPVPDEAKFCHNCGSLVSDAEGQAEATASIDASALTHIEDLLKEDTEGVFEIGRLLGKGGMALVYLATEIHLSRKVALKVLPPELTFGHGVERFMREAKTAAALDHPHIIPIYRVSTGSKIFWYAMKFLEGRALDEILKEKLDARELYSLDEMVKILEPVADALEYGHEHDVIHRDIKPANVMLDSRNRVVVTDFGIAKALTEGTLTASGAVVGTPYYMSPEQGMGKKVAGASDQYSLAVMAYEMLSGQRPFEGDSAIDILHKHCMVDPPPLDVLRGGLPKHVYTAIHRALRKKPEQRFKTVTEFVEGLKQPWAGADEDATLVMAKRPSGFQRVTTTFLAPVRKRRPVALGGMLITALALAGGGTWWWTQMGPGQTQLSSPAGGDQELVALGPAMDTVAADAAVMAEPPSEEARQTATERQPAAATPPREQRAAPARTTPPAGRGAARPAAARFSILIVRTRGARARITVDNNVLTESGRSVRDTLPPGSHIIRAEAPGYVSVDTAVTLTAGQEAIVVLQMRRQDE